MAIGSLLAVLLTRSGSPRLLLACGLALVAVANLLSAGVPWGTATILLRCLGGLGTGLVLSVTNYVFGFGNVERNLAGYMLGFMGLSALVMSGLPFVTGRFGWQAMFLLFALLALPASAFARRFPQRFLTDDDVGTAVQGARDRLTSAVGLGVVFLSTMGQVALFTYVGTLGLSSGFPMTQVETALAYSGWGALLGAILAIVAGERISGLVPTTLIVLATVVAAQASGSRDFAVYAFGISAFFFTIPLYTCAQLGMLMRHAPNRTYAVSLLAAQVVAAALAPASGGAIIAQAGFAPVRLFCAISYLAALLLIIVYVRRANQAQAALASPPGRDQIPQAGRFAIGEGRS
jgi:predicted MFS family arabinose efflux permease